MSNDQTLRAQAQFLADRIADLDWGAVPDSFYRDWNGHVAPALARMNATLAGEGTEGASNG